MRILQVIPEMLEFEAHHMSDAGTPDKRGLFQFNVLIYGHQFTIYTGFVFRYMSRRDYLTELLEDQIFGKIHDLERFEIAATTREDWLHINVRRQQLETLRKRLARLKGEPYKPLSWDDKE